MKTKFLTLLFCLSSAVAFGEASFDALSFRPASDHGYYLTQQSARTLHQGKFHFGVAGDYSKSTLILVDEVNNKVRDVIGHEVAAHLYGAVGITDFWSVGLTVHGVPYQQYFDPFTAVKETSARMGDIVLDTKLRLLNPETHALGIAVVPFVSFPTGNDEHYVGAGTITTGGSVVVETKRIADRFSVALNVGAEIRKEQQLSVATVVNDRLLYGVGLNFAASPSVELIAEGSGWTKIDEFWDPDYRPLMARGAVRFFPQKDLAITVGGGGAVINGMAAPKYETFLSVAYVPDYKHFEKKEVVKKCVDTDGDGICDVDDQCPAEAGTDCGCPPNPLMQVDEDANRIRSQKIYFEFDKATIKDESTPILNAIATTLRVRPEIRRMKMIGYADSIGTEEYNLDLSTRRVRSVHDYLIAHGVDASKLSSEGRGEADPVADNATAEGRAKNRRVEFHIDMDPVSQTRTCKPTPVRGYD